MGRNEQHYMTADERYRLEAYLRAQKPVAWIAQAMGFCRQTIYNEIQRGLAHVVRRMNGFDRDLLEYSADKAQQIHDYNQTAKGRPLKLGNHYSYAQRLEALIIGIQPDGTIDKRKRYSPYAALMTAKKEGYPITLSTNTLYRYIDKGIFLHLSNKDLWEKSKRKKRGYRPIQRIAHPHLPGIDQRPKVINDRSEPGHWEMDLVVSKVGGSKTALLTMTERQSRKEIIVKLPDKTAGSVTTALAQLDTEDIKTITTDNGSEFMRYPEMVHLLHGGEVYYCHSYAAWEKGTNEVHNRMIRRWYPKGTDFKEVTAEEIAELTEWMNRYPRRKLEGLTPEEAHRQAKQ